MKTKRLTAIACIIAMLVGLMPVTTALAGEFDLITYSKFGDYSTAKVLESGDYGVFDGGHNVSNLQPVHIEDGMAKYWLVGTTSTANATPSVAVDLTEKENKKTVIEYVAYNVGTTYAMSAPAYSSGSSSGYNPLDYGITYSDGVTVANLTNTKLVNKQNNETHYIIVIDHSDGSVKVSANGTIYDGVTLSGKAYVGIKFQCSPKRNTAATETDAASIVSYMGIKYFAMYEVPSSRINVLEANKSYSIVQFSTPVDAATLTNATIGGNAITSVENLTLSYKKSNVYKLSYGELANGTHTLTDNGRVKDVAGDSVTFSTQITPDSIGYIKLSDFSNDSIKASGDLVVFDGGRGLTNVQPVHIEDGMAKYWVAGASGSVGVSLGIALDLSEQQNKKTVMEYVVKDVGYYSSSAPGYCTSGITGNHVPLDYGKTNASGVTVTNLSNSDLTNPKGNEAHYIVVIDHSDGSVKISKDGVIYDGTTLSGEVSVGIRAALTYGTNAAATESEPATINAYLGLKYFAMYEVPATQEVSILESNRTYSIVQFSSPVDASTLANATIGENPITGVENLSVQYGRSNVYKLSYSTIKSGSFELTDGGKVKDVAGDAVTFSGAIVIPVSYGLTAEIAKARGGADSIISLIFDDGLYETSVFLNEQFKKYNLHGSIMMITDRIADDKHAGTLEQWQALFAEGYLDAQSHSATHMLLPESEEWLAGTSYSPTMIDHNTPENFQHQLIDSLNTLKANFGTGVVAFAPAYNVLPPEAVEIVQQNYYAMRMGARNSGSDAKGNSLSPSIGTEKGQWHNLYTSAFTDYKATDTETQADKLCAAIDKSVAANKWFMPFCHGVAETERSNDISQEDAETVFAHISELSKEGKVWSASFGEAVRYIRERQNSTVTAQEKEGSVYVNLVMNSTTEDGLHLTKADFSYPLTVKVQLPDDWQAAKCACPGLEDQEVEAFTEGGYQYAYVDIIPNSGEVELIRMPGEDEVSYSLGEITFVSSGTTDADKYTAGTITASVEYDNYFGELPLTLIIAQYGSNGELKGVSIESVLVRKDAKGIHSATIEIKDTKDTYVHLMLWDEFGKAVPYYPVKKLTPAQ